MSIVSPDTNIRATSSPALTEVRGIFPTDLIIKTAIEFGIKDLRANPAQLNMVFASLLVDAETSQLFGQKERLNAINWFNKTELPVLWDLRLASDTFPSISYTLLGDDEQEFTLADVHYQTQEGTQAEWEPLTPQFSPEYDPTTGMVTVPTSISSLIEPSEAMVLVSGTGQVYQILEIVTDSQFLITPYLTVDLRKSVLKNNTARLVTNIESSNFKQTIRIGCHTVGDPMNVIYLHAIVKYVLLRYRRTLLEARGFERSVISSSPPRKNDMFPVENLFSRDITLVGVVRDSWQDAQTERIVNVNTRKIEGVSDGLNASPGFMDTDGTETFIPESGNEDPAYYAMDSIGANLT
jgi:hypothetical protein